MKTNVEIGMVNPSTDELMTKVDSRYGMVVLAAKRARQILEGDPVKSERARSTKNVTNAFEEIAEGKISYNLCMESVWHGRARRTTHRSRRDGRDRCL